MKPSDIKRIVDRLTKLGFKVEVKPGQVDRANRPMSFEVHASSKQLSTEERRAFAEFLGFKALA
jgi:hypothetical protein